MNPLRAAISAYRTRASWLGAGGEPVAPNQSTQRSQICLNCPKNQPNRLLEKASPIIRKMLPMKAQMQLAVPGEDGLHVCSACDCLLKFKVWVPLEHIRRTTPLEELHPNCWILTEIKQCQPPS